MISLFIYLIRALRYIRRKRELGADLVFWEHVRAVSEDGKTGGLSPITDFPGAPEDIGQHLPDRGNTCNATSPFQICFFSNCKPLKIARLPAQLLSLTPTL